MKRRGNSEGSVYRRKDGRWVGAVTLDDGRRRYVYGATQKAARAKLRELQREIAAGRIIPPGPGVTVEAYLRQWVSTTLTARLAAGRLKASTFDSYRDVCERHIIPVLGDERLVSLRPPAVRRWLTAKLAEPSARGRRDGQRPLLSARSVQYFHAVLRKALSDAIGDGYVTSNFAARVEAPVVRRAPVEPLTVSEATRLLRAAAGDRLRVLWLTMLALGLRLGEALALEWDDLDLDAATVTIRRTVQRVRGEPDPATGRRRGELVVSTPKTTASAATLALPVALAAALRVHEARQKRERMRAVAWVNPSLVFASHVGTYLEARNVERSWAALCDRAGVRRARVHDLRHAAASFMLAQGVDLKTIQATLRHSRLATTADVYAHVVAEVRRGAAERMDDVLRVIS